MAVRGLWEFLTEAFRWLSWRPASGAWTIGQFMLLFASIGAAADLFLFIIKKFGDD